MGIAVTNLTMYLKEGCSGLWTLGWKSPQLRAQLAVLGELGRQEGCKQWGSGYASSRGNLRVPQRCSWCWLFLWYFEFRIQSWKNWLRLTSDQDHINETFLCCDDWRWISGSEKLTLIKKESSITVAKTSEMSPQSKHTEAVFQRCPKLYLMVVAELSNV